MMSWLRSLANSALLVTTLIEPLTLDVDRFESDPPRSVQVDVRHDRNRIFFPGDEGPYHVPGTELRTHVPYQGDKMLWRLRPSRYPKGTTACRPELKAAGSRSRSGDRVARPVR